MREIDKVLTSDEKVLWEGKPQYRPYIAGNLFISLFLMLFGIPFAAIPLGMAVAAYFGTHQIWFSLAVLLMPHFWVGLVFIFGPMTHAILAYKNIYYAITDKRVIIQMGIVGRDFTYRDFSEIGDATVDVGLADKLFGNNSGSIMISDAKTPKGLRICNITAPYEVFKFFKKTSFAVKTDIEYPNALRPSKNPGYSSTLSSTQESPPSHSKK